MREILPTLRRWQRDGRRFALATVVQTWGSSPRPVGSVMGVADVGSVVGSVSGGCVETAVMQAALAAIETGDPKMLDFGALTDESVWEVGLSCGGRIRVWVDPNPDGRLLWREVVERIEARESVAIVTRFDPFQQWSANSTNHAPPIELPREVWEKAVASLESRLSEEVLLAGSEYFIQSCARPERLLIVGAVHIAVPLVSLAKAIGFEVVVIDPRPGLASPERFPVEPDEMVVNWPGEAFAQIGLEHSDYAVVLTHDPKIDDVALEVLLRSPVRYIGALGSRTTQEKRRGTLGQKGFSEGDMARIHGPVGLPIGARTPEEIAVSIVAQIVQVRNANC